MADNNADRVAVNLTPEELEGLTRNAQHWIGNEITKDLDRYEQGRGELPNPTVMRTVETVLLVLKGKTYDEAWKNVFQDVTGEELLEILHRGPEDSARAELLEYLPADEAGEALERAPTLVCCSCETHADSLL